MSTIRPRPRRRMPGSTAVMRSMWPRQVDVDLLPPLVGRLLEERLHRHARGVADEHLDRARVRASTSATMRAHGVGSAMSAGAGMPPISLDHGREAVVVEARVDGDARALRRHADQRCPCRCPARRRSPGRRVSFRACPFRPPPQRPHRRPDRRRSRRLGSGTTPCRRPPTGLHVAPYRQLRRPRAGALRSRLASPTLEGADRRCS